MRIVVEAERFRSGEVVTVTEAHITMVAVDALGQPIPFRSAPTVSDTSLFGAEA